MGNGGGDERIGIKKRRHKNEIILDKRVGNRKVCAKISCGIPSTQLKTGRSLRTGLKAKYSGGRGVRVGNAFFRDQPHHWLRIC